MQKQIFSGEYVIDELDLCPIYLRSSLKFKNYSETIGCLSDVFSLAIQRFKQTL
jgi:hypothetical protein